jgi:hypothetical protein
MTTRKFPRTLDEAYGPGHRGSLCFAPEPMIATDKIIVAIGAVVLIALFGSFFFG